ncbi:MAG: heme lyase CcmF/NrfE family subunit [Acidimicrobiia bacterium]
MNAQLGVAGVTLGLAGSVVGALSLLAGLLGDRPKLVRQGKVYALMTFFGSILTVIAMERALITRDFSILYVVNNGSKSTPRLFNIAALWAALEGSIILWTLILTGFLMLVVRHFRTRLADPLVGWALFTMLVICSFFFLLMYGPANPFKEVAGTIPTDGSGPNPLLQNHLLMAFHPPLLYVGLVGFSVPFAFAVAALVTGRVGEGWLLETRRWTLYAWGFLTVGIILGGWWSYEVLGWGGYWGWDPVENASFLPWLTGTAYIHSVLVQERRGMLRVWNLALVCATFSLTILETFLTRSGVLDSVHAFSDSNVGPYLISFFGIVVLATVVLIGWRGDKLRSPGSIDSPVSREGAFLANNVLFSAFAFVILLGTVFPLVVEALQNRRLSVGPPFFNRMTMPLGLALLTLMAIAPVLPWRKASGELLSKRLFWPGWIGAASIVFSLIVGARGIVPLVAFGLGGFAAGAAGRQLVLATRRQGWRGLVGRANGGMIVHLGVVLIAVAFAASQSFSSSREFQLSPGQTAKFEGHEFTYVNTTTVQEKSHIATKANISIDGGQVYQPQLQRFPSFGAPIGVPSVKTGAVRDIYLTLLEAPANDNAPVRIKVLYMPLVFWLWVGGGVMAVGTALSAWPGKRRRDPISPVSAPVPVETTEAKDLVNVGD